MRRFWLYHWLRAFVGACRPNQTLNRSKENMATTTESRPDGRPVIVTTAHRGVFFGYAVGGIDGEQIALKRARLCVRWRDTKGFMGLASDGPNERCRIGPPADITLRAITAVVDVTPEAVERWESAPWHN